jgi:hypothetical protein
LATYTIAAGCRLQAVFAEEVINVDRISPYRLYALKDVKVNGCA